MPLFDAPARSSVQRLRKHQFLVLRRPQGVCLRAERGTLWITIDGDPADIELEAGQSRLLTGRAPVIVGTLGGDAIVSATRRPAPHRPGPWLGWWPALAALRKGVA